MLRFPRYMPGMCEWFAGEDIVAISRELAGDRRYIKTGELARLAHRYVYNDIGANLYQPRWFINELARRGVKPSVTRPPTRVRRS
jgi:hypothetical protein